MALASDPPLSIKTASGTNRSIAQEVDGNTTGNKSLWTLGGDAGFQGDGEVGMLEFLGYTSVQQLPAPTITNFNFVRGLFADEGTAFDAAWTTVTASGATIEYVYSWNGTSNGSTSTGASASPTSGGSQTSATSLSEVEATVWNMMTDFTVYATDVSGSGNWSDSAVATTSTKQSYAAKPYNLTNSASTDTSLSWNWTDMEGGGSAVSYTWTVVEGTTITDPQVGTGDVTNSNVTVSSLTADTTYTNFVTSKNIQGKVSTWSINTAATDPPPTYGRIYTSEDATAGNVYISIWEGVVEKCKGGTSASLTYSPTTNGGNCQLWKNSDGTGDFVQADELEVDVFTRIKQTTGAWNFSHTYSPFYSSPAPISMNTASFDYYVETISDVY